MVFRSEATYLLGLRGVAVTLYCYFNLNFASGLSFGGSRGAILEGIHRYGSIAATSRTIGLSYRIVWKAVRTMNTEFPEPVVTIRVGGNDSGAQLTPYGQKLLRCFRDIDSVLNASLDEHFKTFERLLKEDLRASPALPGIARIFRSDQEIEKPNIPRKAVTNKARKERMASNSKSAKAKARK
jgi:molybdate transport system regulatory protein